MTSKRPNVFLVQVSEKGSTNILQNNRYGSEKWSESAKDADRGKVRPGDLLVIYFAGGAIDYQKQLRFVYRILSVTPDSKEFVVERVQEITGLTLDKIRDNVDTGLLGKSFINCGRQGFNIKQIDSSEFDKVIQLSKELPPPQPVGAEIILEDFIVNNWVPSRYFGEEFEELEIVKDEQGNMIGQQFDTGEIGRIDLLCVDRKTGGYVVIELKKGTETSDNAIGQLARYAGWVRENKANGKTVKGIIVTAGYDKKLEYAIKALPNCYLATYQIQFDISLRR